MSKSHHVPDRVKKTTLPSGLRVLTEEIESVRSLSVGIWIKTGSRHEKEEQAGITHFLEHMLFKGTESRSSYDIALSMESVGGYLNAFTSSEFTCYFARCLDTKLDAALDVLSDMVLHPTFPEEELEKEKKVVLEEMKMYKDNPEDYIFEEFNSLVFKGHPLGRPIIGHEHTVNSFKRGNLYDYMNDRYQPDNLIIAVAGNTNHDEVVKQVEKLFANQKTGASTVVETPVVSYKPDRKELTRPIEQTHYILGRRSLPSDHEDRYKLLLANTVLGGGMSSRLHQHIREQYGYCYAIQSFNQGYSDSGLFGIYVGTDKDYLDHVRELVMKELEALRNEPVSDKELTEAKAQLKGKMLLAQENMSNRMMRLAKSEIYYNRYIPLDELVENIDAVMADDIIDFSQSFFTEDQISETRLMPEAAETSA